MYTTIMAAPLLSIQGRYVILTQQDSDNKSKKRHVIINSDTLAVHGTYEGEDGKKGLEAAVSVILSEGSAPKLSPLEQMMADAEQPSVAEDTDETETDVSENADETATDSES